MSNAHNVFTGDEIKFPIDGISIKKFSVSGYIRVMCKPFLTTRQYHPLSISPGFRAAGTGSPRSSLP